jgi:hypothetical protein
MKWNCSFSLGDGRCLSDSNTSEFYIIYISQVDIDVSGQRFSSIFRKITFFDWRQPDSEKEVVHLMK